MTFNWTARGQKKAFQDMKRCIADLPMVTAIQTNEEMIIYLCAAREAVSAVLLTERDSQQMSIYFVSHALQAPEINYSSMEKLVLALVHVSRSGRYSKPRTSIRGQVLADFIAERPDEDSPLDGPRYGLHLNVDKTELFWPKEDPRSRLEGIFPHNISRPLHGVKLLGGPVSVDVDFGSALVMKRVSKTIGLLDAVAKINDPQCELLLIRACAGVSKLYFTMRTCPLCLCMALFVLPWTLLSRGFSDRGDVLNYAFIASRLQSATLQTKLLRDVGIVAHGSTSSDA
ncbi:putative reverse transcriptase domain-containing protein [Tanacetum coccineum]